MYLAFKNPQTVVGENRVEIVHMRRTESKVNQYQVKIGVIGVIGVIGAASKWSMHLRLNKSATI